MTDKQPDAQRLVEIARRKLAELNIPCETADGGQLLLGTLPDTGAPIINPLSSRPLTGIRFFVEGHDKLHLTDPPDLAGLPPIEFYERPSKAALRAAITSLLVQRAAVMAPLSDRLRKLGFQPESLQRLAHVKALLDLEMIGTVTVEADEDGVQLLECTAIGGGEPVSLERRSLDLEPFQDACDVELFLTPIVEKALREKKPVAKARARAHPAKKTAASRPGLVSPQPASPQSVSLAWLLDILGPDFFARAKFSLSRDLIIDEQPARLDVHFSSRKNIAGRLLIDDELRWKGSLNPAQLGNLETTIQNALKRAAREPSPEEAVSAAADTHGLIPPVPGEVWVMDVQIENESPDEVRYASLNAQGGRQGATRVLQRHTFEKVFVTHGAGHRMLVSVLEASETHVTYQRLNGEREPVAAPRQVPMATFLATFTAEAAAY